MHRYSASLATCLVLASLFAGGQARAQSWLTLPDLAAERGIQAGTFKFWPTVALEGRYDTNIFNTNEEDPTPPQGVALLRVLPGLRIDNPDFDLVHLMFEVQGDIRQYFSDDPSVEAQPQFGVKADLSLDLFPKAVASLRLFDTFRDWLETPNFSTTQSFQRIVNKAGARVSLHPGGTPERRALDVSAQYAYTFDHFVDFEDFDKDQHEIQLLASWKFYPKTALFLDTSIAFNSWAHPDALRGRNDSSPLRAYLGVTGFITKRIATTLKVGYGQGFYDQGGDFQHVIGAASFAWVPVQTTVLELSYDRDFVDSYYANFYVSDRIGLRFEQRLWDRLSFQASAGYAFLSFAEFQPPATSVVNQTQREEQALTADVALNVDIVRYLGIEVGYELTDVFSDFTQRVGEGTSSVPGTLQDRGGYIRHQVYGSIVARY